MGLSYFDEQNKSKIKVSVLCRVHTKKLTTTKVRKLLLLDKNAQILKRIYVAYLKLISVFLWPYTLKLSCQSWYSILGKNIPRFYFNSTDGKCKEFGWGGCDANGNNFKTKEECEQKCEGIYKQQTLNLTKDQVLFMFS